MAPPVAEDKAELEEDLEAASPHVNAPKRRSLDEVGRRNHVTRRRGETKRSHQARAAQTQMARVQRHGGRDIFLLLLVGAGAGMVLGAYNYWLGEIPVEVMVPKYVGQSSENAKAALAKKGLRMKVARESYDPKKPAGTVIAGEPQEGRTVRSQREVLVTVSAGSAPIKMVDFFQALAGTGALDYFATRSAIGTVHRAVSPQRAARLHLRPIPRSGRSVAPFRADHAHRFQRPATDRNRRAKRFGHGSGQRHRRPPRRVLTTRRGCRLCRRAATISRRSKRRPTGQEPVITTISSRRQATN